MTYETGNEVLLFREKIVNNRIGEWIGAFKVSGVDLIRKPVYVQLKAAEPAKAFRIPQFKKIYLPPQQASNIFFYNLRRAIDCFISDSDKERADHAILNDKAVHKNDPWADTDERTEMKEAKVMGLMKFETF